jgi:hypothetical protein
MQRVRAGEFDVVRETASNGNLYYLQQLFDTDFEVSFQTPHYATEAKSFSSISYLLLIFLRESSHVS